MWVWSPETPLVCIPSFSYITIVGEGGRKPSGNHPVFSIDGGGVVSYVRFGGGIAKEEKYYTSGVNRFYCTVFFNFYVGNPSIFIR
jgi:hypothetical protein